MGAVPAGGVAGTEAGPEEGAWLSVATSACRDESMLSLLPGDVAASASASKAATVAIPEDVLSFAESASGSTASTVFGFSWT